MDLTSDQALSPALPRAFPERLWPLDDEIELVTEAKRDAGAFGVLYDAHYPTILDYLYRRTLSVATAEELTSNTFFKALRGLQGFEPRRGIRFRSWLYQIATNELRMHWRSRRSRPVAALDELEEVSRISWIWPATESVESIQEKQRQFAALHQAIDKLPEKYQSVLTLRYFQGLGNEEIATILDKRVGTVKSLVHRGLAKLAATMGKVDATR